MTISYDSNDSSSFPENATNTPHEHSTFGERESDDICNTCANNVSFRNGNADVASFGDNLQNGHQILSFSNIAFQKSKGDLVAVNLKKTGERDFETINNAFPQYSNKMALEDEPPKYTEVTMTQITLQSISFEIIEERQNMVLEYLKEREKADKQSKRRADEIMKQFTTKMNILDSTMHADISHEKVIKSMITQTDCIITKNQALQTTFSDSMSPKSKQNTARFMPAETLSLPDELDIFSDISIEGNKSYDGNEEDHKGFISSGYQSKVKADSSQKENKNMSDLRKLCRHMDGLEMSLEKAYNIIVEKLKIPHSRVEELVCGFKSKSPRSGENKLSRQLKAMGKDKKLSREDLTYTRKKLLEVKNMKEKIEKAEDRLKGLLKYKFSLASPYPTSTIVSTNICSNEMSQTFTDKETAYSFQKDSLATVSLVSTEKDVSKSEKLDPLSELSVDDDDEIEKEIKVLLAGEHDDEKKILLLKEEKERCEKALAETSEKAKENAYQMKIRKTERKEIEKDRNKMFMDKETLENKVKQLNKTIYEKLLVDEKLKEKKEAERRLSDVTKHIQTLESNLSNASAPIKSVESISERSAYLAGLKNNLNKLLPYTMKLSPKYYRKAEKVTSIPNTKEINEILKQRSDLSKRLLHTENQMQMIITSKDFQSDDEDITVTTFSEVSKSANKDLVVNNNNKNSDLEKEKVKINEAIVQLELQLHEMKTPNIENENALRKEISLLRKRLCEVQRLIKTASQIPRPIEENKQLKILKEEIDLITKECQNQGITNFSFDKKYLEQLKLKKKEYESKVEKIRNRIENENIHGENIGNILKDMLHERHRLTTINLSIQNDIENLSYIKIVNNKSLSMQALLQEIEKEALEFKSKNLYQYLMMTKMQINDFIDSLKTNLELQIEERREFSEKDHDETQKEKFKTEYMSIKSIIDNILYDLSTIESNQLKNTTIDGTSKNVKKLLQQKFELTKVLNQVHQSIENKIATTHNKELLKQLLKKKIETRDQLNDNEEKIKAQKFVLKEKLKKYIAAKKNIETKLEDISIADIEELLNSMKRNYEEQTEVKDTLFSLVTERESVGKNLMQAITSKETEKQNSTNMSKVLDSLDAVILNQLQNIVRQINDINSHTKNYVAFTIDKSKLDVLLQYNSELNKIVDSLNTKADSNLQDIENNFESDILGNIEKKRKIAEDFCKRRIEVKDLDMMMHLQELNNEKVDKLLSKIKSLNTLLQTKRRTKIQKNKTMHCSANNAKILKVTAEKIGKELESLVKSFQLDTSEEQTFQSKIASSLTSERKEGINILLKERDSKLHDLFVIEKQLLAVTIGTPQFNELTLVKQKLEQEIDLFDNKIIDSDFSVTQETYVMPIARSFSPKSTSSRHSFVVALDERDIILKRIFDLTRELDLMKQKECFSQKPHDVNLIKNEIEAMKDQLKEIDEKLLEGATLEDDLLNQTLVCASAYSKETLEKDLEGVKTELQTDKLKLHCPRQEENSSADIKELVTDEKERDIFDALESTKVEIRKEKLKQDLKSLEAEKDRLEDDLRGRKSPDRMLLRKEEEELKEKLENQENVLSQVLKRKKIENEIKNLKERKSEHQHHIDKEEEVKFNSFLKNEKHITIKEYKKNKVALENELDTICMKMAQYSKSLETEIKSIEKDLSQSSTQHSYRKTVEWSFEIDDGLDALRGHQCELKGYIHKLNNAGKERESEKASMNSLLKQRAESVKRLSKVTDNIKKLKFEKREESISNNLKQLFNRSKEILRYQKILKLKISAIDSEIQRIRGNHSHQQKTDLERLKTVVGIEIWDGVLEHKKLDILEEVKGMSLYQYIETLKKSSNKEKALLSTKTAEQDCMSQSIVIMKDQINDLQESLAMSTKEIEKQKLILDTHMKEREIEKSNWHHEKEKLVNSNSQLIANEEAHLKNIKELQKALQELKHKSLEVTEESLTTEGKDQSGDIFPILLDLSSNSNLAKDENFEKIMNDINVLDNRINHFKDHFQQRQEKEKLLLNQIERQEKLVLTKELETKEAKNFISTLQLNFNNMKSQLNFFRNIILDIREEKDSLQKELHDIQNMNINIQSGCISIQNEIEESRNDNRMIQDEIETMNNEISRIKTHRICNIMNEQELNDKQSLPNQFQNNSKNDILKRVTQEKDDLKAKMESLWNEIVNLKEELSRQREVDRREKEKLNEKLTIYIHKLEQDQQLKKNEADELTRLKEEVQRYLNSQSRNDTDQTSETPTLLYANEVAELKQTTDELKTQLQKQKSLEVALTEKQKELQRELNNLKRENEKLDEKLKSHTIGKDIGSLKKDIVSKKEQAMYCIPKEKVVERIFELQKLNVILELKSVFSGKNLRNAEKELSVYRKSNKKNEASVNTGPLTNDPFHDDSNNNTLEKNSQIAYLERKNNELQNEVDRCKRIIFKKGRTASSLSNYKEEQTFDGEQMTEENIADLQANPNPTKKPQRTAAKEEEVTSTKISDDVKSVMKKVLHVVTSPVPVEPIQMKTDYRNLKKEEVIMQETLSELMVSDETALESSKNKVKSMKDVKEKKDNELKELKAKLKNANAEIEKLHNEKKFYGHDVDILRDDINAIKQQKQSLEDSFSKSQKQLKEKNMQLERENSTSKRTISNLKNNLEELHNKLHSLQQEIDDLQKNYDSIKKLEKDRIKDNENLKITLFKTETDLSREKEKSKKIENEFSNIQKESDSNLDKVTKSQNEIKALKGKLDHAIKENSLKKKEAHSNAIELQRKIHELQKHTEDLEHNIEELNEENINLEKQINDTLTLKNEESDQQVHKIKELEMKSKEYENRIFRLEKEKISLENKLTDEFEEKNRNLKELHENLKNAIASKTKTIENSKEVEGKLNEKMNRLKDRIRQLEDDNNTFASRLQDKTNVELRNRSLEKDLDRQKNEYDDLIENYKRLKNELERSEENAKTLKVKIKSLENICGDNLFINLKENVSDISIGDKSEDPCTHYIKSMLKERKTLDSILKEIYDENKNMELQIKNVQENLKYMKKEKDSKIISLEDANKNLQANNSEIEKENIDLTKQNEELLDEIKQYSEKVDTLDSTIHFLKNREEEMKNENKRLMLELNHHIDKLEISEKDITKLNEIIDDKERNLTDLHSDLMNTKQTTDRIEEEIRVLSEEKYGAMNVIDKTQAEYQKLQSEFSKVNNERSIAENNMESLKIELKKLSREKDVLQKESDNKSQNYLQKEKEVMDLKKLNNMLEQDVVKYNETIKKINKEDAELIKELESEKALLKSQLDTQIQNVDNLVNKESNLKDEYHLLDEKLEFTEQKLMKAEREVSILKEVLDSQKTVTDELKAHLNSERNTKKDIQEKLRVAVKEKSVLNDKYTKQSVELAFLRETIDSIKASKIEIQNQLDDLNQQVRQTNKEREILHEEMAKESKLNETYEDNIFNLTQTNRLLENDLESCKDTINKLNENVDYLEEQKDKITQNHDALKLELIEMKDKYDSLAGRYHQEMTAVNKELANAKKKLEEQRSEINHINEHTELEIKGQLKIIKEAFENEKNNQTNLINDLKDKLAARMLSSTKDDARRKEIAELEQVQLKLESRCNELESEKHGLMQKLNETNEIHDREVTETRRQLTEKFKKNIDKLSLKSKDLSNEIIDMEKLKNQLEIDRNSLMMDNKKLVTEIDDLRKSLDERSLQLEEKDRNDKIRESTLQFELDGLRLENNDLLEQVKHLKYQINKNELYKHYEKEIQDQKKQLEMSMREFEEEKTNFEANIEEIFMRSNEMYIKSEFEKNEKIKNEKIRICQEEKEKLNNEINKLNKELSNAKNEIRKLKTRIQEKEEEFLIEEKKMLSNVEKEWKAKFDETNKSHAKEKANLMALNQDDRYKFEQEMETLKLSLKEDTSKKLTEQREDFEKELKEHIYQYLRQNQEEVDELLEKNDTLKSEKLDLIREYENERVMMKRKYDSERYALVETIRRLLKNVMKFKAQKVKLKHSHRDEISVLEERFEIEREKLEEKCEQEIELLRENLHRSQRFQEHTDQHHRFNNEPSNFDYRYGPIRTKPEKESDAVSLAKPTSADNENLILPRINDLAKISDSSDENNSDSDAEFVRTQYESELRKETDALMKRLLEISDELDSLRSTT